MRFMAHPIPTGWSSRLEENKCCAATATSLNVNMLLIYGNLTWMIPSCDDSQFFSNIHIKASPQKTPTQKFIKHAETVFVTFSFNPTLEFSSGRYRRNRSSNRQVQSGYNWFCNCGCSSRHSSIWWFQDTVDGSEILKQPPWDGAKTL